jgi:choline-glycine betaine transporter
MLAFQLSASVLFFAALLQLVFVLATGQSNQRLAGFGRSLGRYLGQIAGFETFATEELPFPFSDWPSVTVADRAAY